MPKNTTSGISLRKKSKSASAPSMRVRGTRGYRRQKGQAIVLGLLFLAISLVAMVALYNQSQLVRHRVQLENSADATAYSIAKLAARNHNFVAYTNRAMVANEVSVGQIAALISWAKHYRDIRKFTAYPLYQTPIAPPSPVTYSMVLNTITIPYQAVGYGVDAAASRIGNVWPTVVSNFNSALGVFQSAFALSTMVAQFETHQDVIEANQLEDDNADIYPSFLSFLFLTKNILETYSPIDFGQSDMEGVMEDLAESNPDSEDAIRDASEQLQDFFPTTAMIGLNSPNVSKKDDDDVKDATLDAYKYYAALVNKNRDPFTEDRHWQFPAAGTIPDLIPRLTLDAGIVKLIIDLDFSLWFGVKNDGGAAFQAQGGLKKAEDISKLGWAAIDVLSIGVEIEVGLFVRIEVCLPIVGCEAWTLIDLNFELPIGFPLGGATHQLVAEQKHALKILTDWGKLDQIDGPYGGDPDDPVNQGPFEAFHTQTLLWGQSVPPPIYGGPTNVTTSYAGVPIFASLDDSYRQSRQSREYIVALAIDLGDVETSDSDTFDMGNGGATPAETWLEGREDEVTYDRFDLDTCSRSEEASLEGLYQQVVFTSKRPMSTISSAEAYFSNPMQDGNEPASLFSPFWDARLKPNSLLPTAVATGEIEWSTFLPGAPDDAIGVINWTLDRMADRLIDEQVDYVVSQIDSPWDSVAEPPIRMVGNRAYEASENVVDKMTDGLTDFVGMIGKSKCAG